MRRGKEKRQTMKGLEAPVRTVRSPGGFSGEKTDVMCVSKRISLRDLSW